MNKDSTLLKISLLFLLVFISFNMLFLFEEKQIYFIIFIDFLFIFFYLYLHKKIRELTSSRTIFLRNIMHELKTPITKGKIITDTLDKSKKQDTLKGVFYRLEYLLKELTKIEELTSRELKLKKSEFRVVDIMDHALDMSLLSKSKITIHKTNANILVDFDLFSIAFKNLLENAILYNKSDTPEIFIEKNQIVFKNRGERLKKNIKEYYKIFNNDYESSKNLGLGLYITNSIIKIHNFKLNYNYKDSYHYFTIVFS